MAARVGFAEFDAQGYGVHVGWAEFDALGAPYQVCVAWAEFDCQSPTPDTVPPFRPGGGMSRYHSHARQEYVVPVVVDEAEEEDIILRILMEIAKHEL